MSDTLHSLPWLDRLSVHVPGYRGYQTAAQRRAADQALREAIAKRLNAARSPIDAAIKSCTEREALTEKASLERVEAHLDRVIQRVRSASSGVEPFFEAGAFRPAKADSLHALDHAMLELAEELVTLISGTRTGHDWLARIEERLVNFDKRLDARALVHKMADE
jgi:hypothetical protein